jgi:IS605 OrfB family transposase
MQRTIKIKIDDNPYLIKTIELYTAIYKKISLVGLANKTGNKNQLHRLTYKQIRQEYPNFPSALIQTVRDIASESLKRTKLKKEINPKKYSSIRLDKRNLRVSLEYNLISISSINGRIKTTFKNNPQIEKYKLWSVKAGTLSYKNNQLILNLVVEKESPAPNINNTVLGIDRGINNVLVCSNNQFFNANHLKAIKGKYQHMKAKLQSIGTRSAKRKLKIIAGRERRFVQDLNHQLSKLIANSGYTVFALEHLAKIKQNKGKKFNKKLGNWSFAQFEKFLSYKAEELGKIVVKVNPKHTSQKCSKCGHIEKSNRNGAVFKCKACGFELHSDLNAARNIANLGKTEISRLNVNQPIVATKEVKTEVSYKPIFLTIGS